MGPQTRAGNKSLGINPSSIGWEVSSTANLTHADIFTFAGITAPGGIKGSSTVCFCWIFAEHQGQDPTEPPKTLVPTTAVFRLRTTCNSVTWTLVIVELWPAPQNNKKRGEVAFVFAVFVSQSQFSILCLRLSLSPMLCWISPLLSPACWHHIQPHPSRCRTQN